MNAMPQAPIFAASPICWEQGVQCRFGQLPAVLEKARADGFQAVRMHVIRLGYRLEFSRIGERYSQAVHKNTVPSPLLY